jgi:hypothetical protein
MVTGATSCDGNEPATESLKSDPCCALLAAANPDGLLRDPRLLISQRRDAPTDDRWELLGDTHIPQVTPGTPEWVWPYLLDVKEVALPTGGNGYQVHDLITDVVLGRGATLNDMIQGTNGLWGPVRTFVGTSAVVPSGQPGGPLGTDLGRAGHFTRVSGAAVGNQLHVCAVEAHGQVERNIYDPASDRFEGWTDIEMKSQSEVGQFVDVACAAVVNPATGLEELHVCGVTDDGRLWHSVESPFRTFSPFQDVELANGQEVGQFKRVDCAGNKGQLHLVGVTTNGRAWHTIRIPGGWSGFQDILDQAPPDPPTQPPPGGHGGMVDVAIGFCNDYVPADGPRDVSQLNVVLTEGGGQTGQSHIWHTIRSTNTVSWSPGSAPSHWRPIRDLGPIINRGSLSPVPATTVSNGWGGFSVGFRPFRPY